MTTREVARNQSASPARRAGAVDLAVIGAGWAGLAAAVHATRAGARVALFERAAFAGGRAREIRLELDAGPVRIDSGQHALLGAYRECLELARITGGGRTPFERVPMRLADTAGLRLEVRARHAPWHLLGALLRARGLTSGERLAALGMMAALRLRGWHVEADETVAALLARLHQPPALVRRLWQPLCVGVMNTAPALACAAAFAAVLRDTLGGPRAATDFLVPAGTLHEALTQPAVDWLQTHGAEVRLQAGVRDLRRTTGQWEIDAGPGTNTSTVRAPHVVIATTAADAARLLVSHLAPDDPRLQRFARLRHEPIASILLAWRHPVAPALPRWILLHDDGEQAWGQWLFARGSQGGWRLATVVISVASALPTMSRGEMADAVAHQVSRQLGVPLADVRHAVIEKRATLRCTPDRPRFHQAMFGDHLPGIWLAGDYVDDEYPATLETAVRSGRRAVAAALAGRRRDHSFQTTSSA